MADQPSQDEVNLWRRRLGSGANNRAWTLAEKSSRTPDEDAEMLHAAHAARYLWSKIGTQKNLALADLLLGQVHASLGFAQTAMEYSEKGCSYFTSLASKPEELAMAYAVLANAAHASGNPELHRTSYVKALEIADTLNDPEERKIFDATFNGIPKPMPAPSAV